MAHFRRRLVSCKCKKKYPEELGFIRKQYSTAAQWRRGEGGLVATRRRRSFRHCRAQGICVSHVTSDRTISWGSRG
ncbi:hypothetical protein RSAG8_02467, partial [Rhizoctonia solani AG-8 WAC10335]